jgi:hypothetical protein
MYLEQVCKEGVCMPKRKLEAECFIVKGAMNEYKQQKLASKLIKDTIKKKINDISQKYYRYKPIIYPAHCKRIEKDIVKCCIMFESLN